MPPITYNAENIIMNVFAIELVRAQSEFHTSQSHFPYIIQQCLKKYFKLDFSQENVKYMLDSLVDRNLLDLRVTEIYTHDGDIIERYDYSLSHKGYEYIKGVI